MPYAYLPFSYLKDIFEQFKKFFGIFQIVLQNFIRVDSLLTLCIQTPKESDNFRTAELHINYILLLKGMLNAIPTLIDSISLNLSVRIREIKMV